MQARRFLGTHAAVYNPFNFGRHLVRAQHFRDLRGCGKLKIGKGFLKPNFGVGLNLVAVIITPLGKFTGRLFAEPGAKGGLPRGKNPKYTRRS